MSIINSMNAAGMGMVAQSHRISAISSNIANINTVASSPKEAFKAMVVEFKTVNIGENTQSVVVSKVLRSEATHMPIFDPSNPLADENGYLYASNVGREEQVADLISAETSYQLDTQLSATLKSIAIQSIQSLNK